MNRRDLLKGTLVVTGASVCPASLDATTSQMIPPPLFRNLPGDPLRAMNELHSRIAGEMARRAPMMQDELAREILRMLHSFDDLFHGQFGFNPLSHNIVTGPTGKLGIKTYFESHTSDLVWVSSTKWGKDGQKILAGGCRQNGTSDYSVFYRLIFDSQEGQNYESSRSPEGYHRHSSRGVTPIDPFCRTDKPTGASGGAAKRVERTLRPRGRALPVRCEGPRAEGGDDRPAPHGDTGVRNTLRVQGAPCGVRSAGGHERPPEPAEHHPLQITLD